MICKSKYKDIDCVQVKSGSVTAVFLPGEGGKMASLIADGFEFLEQAPGGVYGRLGINGNFVESECSAFDDMFPTIDEYFYEADGRRFHYLDHGEAARTALTCEIGDELVMQGELINLDVHWKKSVREADGGVSIRYEIANHSGSDLPFILAFHLMIAGRDDLVIKSSYRPEDSRTFMFRSDNADRPLDRLEGKNPDGAAYKFYYDEPITEGRMTAEYTESGHSLTVSFDKNQFPYIGLWFNNGGFKNMYNIAPEIATAPYDRPDKAMEAGRCSVLRRDETLVMDVVIATK